MVLLLTCDIVDCSFPVYKVIIDLRGVFFQPPGFAGPFTEMPDPSVIPDELKNECKVTWPWATS